MKKTLWFCVAIFLFELVIAAIVYPTLPDTIPIHFNFSGEADGFGGRWNIFLLPMLTSPESLLALFMIERAMRKDEKLRRMEKTVGFVALGLQVLFTVIFAAFIWRIKGGEFGIDKAVLGVSGLVMLVLGNFMPKFKQNPVMGIRTPWSMRNEVVWQKSQRFGGMLFVTAGALCFLSCLLPLPWNGVVPVAYLSLVAVAIMVHSYVVYRKEVAK
ncbi:MAG: DUF1648 domain-containing protein [Oscillospiraceae bacterium]|jgi:uncharacterized membrane protein|nr:DUF1648 domain-containing protein [Oscillospiraceae bacterium]